MRHKDFLNIFYWACATILWTYMSVSISLIYKSWYITTIFVLCLTAFLLVNRAIVTRGLYKSSGFLLIYYLYLLLTATWAQYPMNTLFYALTETIYIFIFILFYLLSKNLIPSRIIDFFVNLVPPAAIIFIISYLLYPQAIRIGWHVLLLLPLIMCFCFYRLFQSFSGRYVFIVSVCLLMLLFGKARMPLVISVLEFALIFFVTVTSWKMRLKLLAVSVGICIITAVIIYSVQPLRLNAANTIARMIYQDVEIGNDVGKAEAPDLVRWAIYYEAVRLYKTNWLFGIGYMNFMPWFGDEYHYSQKDASGNEEEGMNLHNTFQTWALEGGVPCLFISGLLIWKYFSILKKRIMLSKNNYEKIYYKLYVIAMICTLLNGLFHQIHQTPSLFILLGLVYALDPKYNEKIVFQPSPKAYC